MGEPVSSQDANSVANHRNSAMALSLVSFVVLLGIEGALVLTQGFIGATKASLYLAAALPSAAVGSLSTLILIKLVNSRFAFRTGLLISGITGTVVSSIILLTNGFATRSIELANGSNLRTMNVFGDAFGVMTSPYTMWLVIVLTYMAPGIIAMCHDKAFDVAEIKFTIRIMIAYAIVYATIWWYSLAMF